MTRTSNGIVALMAVLSGGCSGDDGPPANQASAASERDGAAASSTKGAERWDLQSSGEGVALALLDGSGGTLLRLFCPSERGELLVNVPGFRPIGSEERLSVGSGGEVVALVADSRGDRLRGGVSGTGAVPDNLAGLVGSPIAVNYGSQDSGPHSAPPGQEARAFVAACGKAGEAEPRPAPPAGPAPLPASACLVQDGRPVPAIRLRAIGTEPFWGASIEGRCVTYSHPENQAGTRLWTRFTGSAQSGVWTGFYQNQRFVLRTRPQAGCSDGMSDNRYPIAVQLTVAGVEREGCARPL